MSGIKLSKREADVLHGVGLGLTNAEIAESLCLETQSVKNVLVRAYAKLGAKNRTDALLKALRLGLVAIDEESRVPIEREP